MVLSCKASHYNVSASMIQYTPFVSLSRKAMPDLSQREWLQMPDFRGSETDREGGRGSRLCQSQLISASCKGRNCHGRVVALFKIVVALFDLPGCTFCNLPALKGEITPFTKTGVFMSKKNPQFFVYFHFLKLRFLHEKNNSFHSGFIWRPDLLLNRSFPRSVYHPIIV